MKNKLNTVCIAFSAYNEEKNIEALLRSIINQDQKGFVLKKILVIDDGSTDDTYKIVKNFKTKLIKIMHYSKRQGKSYRLNYLYKNLDCDILVQTDSDVVFANRNVLSNLVKPLLVKNNIYMCGGNPIPLSAESIIEDSVNLSTKAYIVFREKVRGGNNVFSADGRLLAYRKEFINQVRIPTDMIANDMFTYFYCLKLGYKYKYVKSAVVHYRSPQNISDQIKQNTRFRASPIRMKRYFDSNLINSELAIPKNLYYKTLLKFTILNPIQSVIIFLLNLYSKFLAIRNENKLNGVWDMITSTKTLAKS